MHCEFAGDEPVATSHHKGRTLVQQGASHPRMTARHGYERNIGVNGLRKCYAPLVSVSKRDFSTDKEDP
jgi:hypothetical protein